MATPDRVPHATNAGYTNHGCRCEGCVEAHRVYHKHYARRRAGRTPREAGLSEIASTGVTLEELVAWDAQAEKAGLSRSAFIRRSVNETVELERALERQRERELASPLLDHGG